MSTSTNTLTIGKVARRAGVGVETIRFYEREKLLPKPARDPSSGYRRYPESTVARLQFIARAKELGFTLKETRELLELRTGPATCGTVRARAEEKLGDVRRKIEDLQRIERALLTLADACPGDGALDDCPILGALEGRLRDAG
ncbi:MAG: MerR family transcriptional regulator [Deltaproteobacteria bacterium]|nr:MAG: MerR family transcriptional regulator [Deltaproteobacteria bacterium]